MRCSKCNYPAVDPDGYCENCEIEELMNTDDHDDHDDHDDWRNYVVWCCAHTTPCPGPVDIEQRVNIDRRGRPGDQQRLMRRDQSIRVLAGILRLKIAEIKFPAQVCGGQRYYRASAWRVGNERLTRKQLVVLLRDLAAEFMAS